MHNAHENDDDVTTKSVRLMEVLKNDMRIMGEIMCKILENTKIGKKKE